jgi:hypothetical protein
VRVASQRLSNCPRFGSVGILTVAEERAMPDEILIVTGEDYPELRVSVRKICARYPGAYWSGHEEKEAYPNDFINELTEARFLVP